MLHATSFACSERLRYIIIIVALLFFIILPSIYFPKFISSHGMFPSSQLHNMYREIIHT